jgi:hypothetical protein
LTTGEQYKETMTRIEEDWYLSLGGETRQRYEIYHNFPFSPTPPNDPSDDNGYYLMRYMLHGDLHLGQSVRVFAQFKSAIAVDKSLVTGADRDDLDVNQLFIEINSQLRDLVTQPLGYGTVGTKRKSPDSWPANLIGAY